MAKEYIEERDGNYYVAGTRISLDSIIHTFRRGEFPETICQNFELLRLEEVYGAVAYYLANQAGIDAYLIRQDEKWAECRRTSEPLPGRFAGKADAHSGRGARHSPVVKVRFLADADLNRAIVNGVLRRGCRPE